LNENKTNIDKKKISQFDNFFRIEYKSLILLKVVDNETLPVESSLSLTFEPNIFSNLLVASI
jgi:hypothetical protein